ncbi:hypothetical protein AM424_003961 [Acinetobacter baumannii]|nr:hypothetical protein AM424_003961 [Acinetobacter baumannii]
MLLKQHKFPLEADITFEMVTSGKSMKYVVKQVDCKGNLMIDVLDEDGASNIAHPEIFGKPK